MTEFRICNAYGYDSGPIESIKYRYDTYRVSAFTRKGKTFTLELYPTDKIVKVGP